METKNLFKKGNKLAILVLAVTITLNSCKREDDQSTIDETEAVDAISNSLSSESNGMSKSIESTMTYAAANSLYKNANAIVCGQVYTDNFNESSSTASYSYSYSATCNYTLDCSSKNLSYDASRKGNYTTPRMTSNDDASSKWILSNLDISNESALVNGSYSRNGTQTSKVKNLNNFTSKLTYTLSNIAVSKSTKKIISGTASVVFDGTSSTGNTYTYKGSITFNNNNTATLIINGNTYTINL